ncbi:uncharacterized protein LOC117318890 [Pecten maximus]|uniref:uncharacterized protein LOC117318890 n=1 Tax=Pecten maximus TaxID=6579 RepID=UPI00145914B2|nr:uncharacterized protein LOC117318890 [Pecten maximus]
MVECDIRVPNQWATGFERELSPYEYFSEMAPIFCNTDIPFSAIGEHMKEHVRRNKLSDKPRRLLIGGMAARKMLIATPLLKWYIEHGMQVDHIYQVVEYTPMACFREFVTDVTDARRRGDDDKMSAVIANTMKLIGNSAYGGLIMDKSKHTNIKYVRGETNACNAINDPRFKDLHQLDEDIFEVENAKRTITYDLPIQLGYFILQYAKLRMLEYYYDFMDVFVDRSDFAYCEMDTDSAYMAISGKRLEDIIKADKRQLYDNGLYGFCHVRDVNADNRVHWFPRKCCNDHEKRDKRTPGLFKLEYEGDRIVSLSSKTYCVTKDDDIKFSAKGIQRKTIEDNSNAFRVYEDVLKTKETKSAVNIGFRARNNTVFTYQQEKQGFTYFYCKREVLSNGIDTKVLDLVLCPEKKDPTDVRMADILCELLNE